MKNNINQDYDFGGWATRNNIKCSDGKTIMKDAFKDNDGQKVPLVWNHQHNDPGEVLGHALLENREDGVYAYCKFNNTESGQIAKSLVTNGDVDKLSIYANRLKTQMNNVMHGCIREVSLVLAGANPGAFIDTILSHADGLDEEAIIYNDEHIESLEHSDKNDSSDEEEKSNMDEKENKKENEKEKTIEEIFETLNEEQKAAVYAIVGEVMQHSDDNTEESDEESDEESEDNSENKEESTESEEDNEDKKENNDKGEEDMKHNVFNIIYSIS